MRKYSLEYINYATSDKQLIFVALNGNSQRLI